MRALNFNTRSAFGALAAVLVMASPALAQTQYHPISPCRLFDSRKDGPRTPLTGQEDPGREITVKNSCGIPNDATAISYNVTVVNSSAKGFLTMYPAGSSRPAVSAINFAAGVVQGNGGVVPLASGSPDLTIYLATNPAAGLSHVVLDASGYFKEPAP